MILTLASCASFNNPREIKEQQLDGLKFESLTRYDQSRLDTPLKSKSTLALCHKGDFDEANKNFKAILDQNLQNYAYGTKLVLVIFYKKSIPKRNNSWILR